MFANSHHRPGVFKAKRLPQVLLLGLALLSAGVAEAAPENRCGWVVNPTPGNWWLTDRDDTWIMTSQGGEQEPDGMDKIGDISAGDYVATNGYYGYACGCMKVDVDKTGKRIARIYSFRQLPIAKCRADTSLPSADQ